MNIRRLQRINRVRISNEYSTVTTIKSGQNIEWIFDGYNDQIRSEYWMNTRRLQRSNQVLIVNIKGLYLTLPCFLFPFFVIGCSFIAFFLWSSVADQDPQIRTSDYWLTIRTLLISSGWLSRWQLKSIFFLCFSAYYFLKLHLHHFSKIKSQRSHETVGIKVFLTIFAWW